MRPTTKAGSTPAMSASSTRTAHCKLTRPDQGRDQVWRRVDQLGRARKCRGPGTLPLPRPPASGVYHPKWDERPVLFVVKKAGAEVTGGEIIEHLKPLVAKWWLPDAVEFVG